MSRTVVVRGVLAAGCVAAFGLAACESKTPPPPAKSEPAKTTEPAKTSEPAKTGDPAKTPEEKK